MFSFCICLYSVTLKRIKNTYEFTVNYNQVWIKNLDQVNSVFATSKRKKEGVTKRDMKTKK